MQPVWVLSVDLQTKTATFQSGLGDAARAARGSFTEIKEGARACGAETGYSMTEARHGVMLLGEEFGVHIPRALTSFLAGLGPIGGAMEAAFPFLAIAVGATLLIEHLVKMREEGEKLTENQLKFGIAVQNAFNALDKQLLEAGIRADELNGNHLGALKKQLELIDRQSMSELVKSFDEVAKAADVVFAELKSHWYTVGIGSAGASHALAKFKTEYDALLASGKDKEASDLLAGTRQSAEHTLDMMKQLKNSQAAPDMGKQGDYGKYEAAKKELKTRAGITEVTKEEYESQIKLLETLKAQEEIQGKVAQLKSLQGSNAKQGTQNKLDADADKEARAQADAEKRGLEVLEKEREAAYRSALSKLEQSEREKIEATEKGSAARLAAINAAIKEENNYGLQETGFYRSLLTSRVEVARQMTDEQNKITAEAGKQQAEHALKMDELQIASDREAGQLRASMHRETAAQIIAQETRISNEEFMAKSLAYAREISALDKNGKDYENKLKAIQNKQTELIRAHENEITQIKDKAEIQRNQRIMSAESRMQDAVAGGLTNVLMRHQSFASMMDSLGSQVATGIMQNAIKSALADDFTKEKDAAKAARKAFNSGMELPAPANVVIAPLWAAAAFASVMAFQDGGVVPGTGRGDIVPAMLEPGEGVIPKSIMDAARSGGGDSSGGGTVHLHHSPTYHVQVLDSGGVREVLQKHSNEFSKHFQNELRKMNR